MFFSRLFFPVITLVTCNLVISRRSRPERFKGFVKQHLLQLWWFTDHCRFFFTAVARAYCDWDEGCWFHLQFRRFVSFCLTFDDTISLGMEDHENVNQRQTIENIESSRTWFIFSFISNPTFASTMVSPLKLKWYEYEMRGYKTNETSFKLYL